MHRFKCTLCGICCRASPVSLLPYEDIVLRLIAQKLRLPYRSRPGYRVFDQRSMTWIALSYAMLLADGKCIFLGRDDLCMINDIYKPLICRSYPYVPKQIRYTLSLDFKMIFSVADYGLSIKCPVVEEDQYYISELMRSRPDWAAVYMPNEFKAIQEFEEKRRLLLGLLSQLWMRGIVELRENGVDGAPTFNLYEVLRRFYPNLIYVLEIDKVLKKMREM